VFVLFVLVSTGCSFSYYTDRLYTCDVSGTIDAPVIICDASDAL
jgi:hypothetical protein